MTETWILACRMSGETSTAVTVTSRTRGSFRSVKIAMLTTSRIASAAFCVRREVMLVNSVGWCCVKPGEVFGPLGSAGRSSLRRPAGPQRRSEHQENVRATSSIL